MAKPKAKAAKKPTVQAKKKAPLKKASAKVAPKKHVAAKAVAKKPAAKSVKSKASTAKATKVTAAKAKASVKKAPVKIVAKAPAKAPPAALKPVIKKEPKPAKVAPAPVVAKVAPPPVVNEAPAPTPKKAKADNAKKTAKVTARAAASAVRKIVNLNEIELPPNYRPTTNEEYMSPTQLAYFKRKLEAWRQELIIESQETLEHLRSETRDVGDDAERASRESDNILELRTRDRYRKLLSKIGQALRRIEDGEYGYCEETGEEIGLARLEARPIATLTVDAQERREMFQRQFRDDH